MMKLSALAASLALSLSLSQTQTQTQAYSPLPPHLHHSTPYPASGNANANGSTHGNGNGSGNAKGRRPMARPSRTRREYIATSYDGEVPHMRMGGGGGSGSGGSGHYADALLETNLSEESILKQYQLWCAKFQRREDNFRFIVFQRNYLSQFKWNLAAGRKAFTLNRFADCTEEEYHRMKEQAAKVKDMVPQHPPQPKANSRAEIVEDIPVPHAATVYLDDDDVHEEEEDFDVEDNTTNNNNNNNDDDDDEELGFRVMTHPPSQYIDVEVLEHSHVY